jgi:hypothetical protein
VIAAPARTQSDKTMIPIAESKTANKVIGTYPTQLHQLVQTEVQVWYPDKRRAKDSSFMEVWMTVSALINKARQMQSLATTVRGKDEGAR